MPMDYRIQRYNQTIRGWLTTSELAILMSITHQGRQ
ncbi:hypothetical protein [Bullifex porci]